MKPKFELLDRIDRFLVAAYIGFTDSNPRNRHVMSKPQHWYVVRCACSHDDIRSQQELMDRRRVNACKDCRNEINHRVGHVHI